MSDSGRGFAGLHDAGLRLDGTLDQFVLALRTVADEGILAHIDADVRAFVPGERTGDIPWLGEQHGVIPVAADLTGLPTVDRVVWTTQGPGGVPGPAFIQDANSLEFARVYAGEPGVHVLHARAMEGDAVRAEGTILLSVPWFLEVASDPSFEALVPDDDHRVALLIEARDAAYYVLRPANVRLIWRDIPEETLAELPEHFDDGFEPDDGVLTSGPWDALLGRARGRSFRVRLHGAADRDVSMWGTDVDREDEPRTAHVFDPLGSQADGTPDTEAVLARFRQAYEADVASGAGDDTDLGFLTPAGVGYVELAGRRLGVRIARAVLELMSVDETASPHPGALMHPFSDDEHRDWLGIQAVPDPGAPDSPPDLDRVVADLTADPPAPDPRWIDLVSLYDGRWQSTSPSGGRPGLELLAGPCTKATLDRLEELAPLPPPYGGYALAPGDDDARSLWGGQIRTGAETPLPASHELGYVELLHDDLGRLGLELDLPDPGRFHAREREAIPSLSPDVHAHSTEAALMLVQAATRYEHRYVERPTGAPRLQDDLVLLERDPSLESLDVTGELNPATAWILRRWRFQRYRYPIPASVEMEEGDPRIDVKRTSEHHRALPSDSAEGRVDVADIFFFSGSPAPWSQADYDATYGPGAEPDLDAWLEADGDLEGPPPRLAHGDFSTLESDDGAVLDAILDDPEFENQHWVIIGYADARPVAGGGPDSNRLITWRRATAVYLALREAATARGLSFPEHRVRVFSGGTVERWPLQPEHFPFDRRVSIRARRLIPNKVFFTEDEVKKGIKKRLEAVKQNPFKQSGWVRAVTARRLMRAYLHARLMLLLRDGGVSDPPLGSAYRDILKDPHAVVNQLERQQMRVEKEVPFSSSAADHRHKCVLTIAEHQKRIREDCYYRIDFLSETEGRHDCDLTVEPVGDILGFMVPGDPPIEDRPFMPPAEVELVDDDRLPPGDRDRYTHLGKKLFDAGFIGDGITYMSGEDHLNYMENPPATDACRAIDLPELRRLRVEARQLLPPELAADVDEHVPDP